MKGKEKDVSTAGLTANNGYVQLRYLFVLLFHLVSLSTCVIFLPLLASPDIFKV